MAKVTTFLMFQGAAEEAVGLYVSLFADSEIVQVERYGPGEPKEEGSFKTARFTLAGREFLAFDSPPTHPFGFTPAISLFVDCDDPEEQDAAFARLSEGGSILMPMGEYGFSRRFAWLNDRFGVSWQLNLPFA